MMRLLAVLLVSACSVPSGGTLWVAPSTKPDGMVPPGQGPRVELVPLEQNEPIACVGGVSETIQEAIDVAASGDVLVVCPGIHFEHLVIAGKQLTLRSRDGAGVTIIDADAQGQALVIEEGADVVISGLTLRNGRIDGTGGNVMCTDANVSLRGSVIEAGKAERGGGFGTFSCTGRIEGNTFLGNGSTGKGGGLYVREGIDVVDNWFEGNSAGEGGGAYIKESTADIVGNTFVDNSSIDDGGGCFAYDGAPVIDGNTFERNFSDEEAGGLRVKIAEAVITNNLLVDNYADWRGGGAKISHDEVFMSGNTFTGNVAGQWAGGALLYESASLLTNETYIANEADDAGALAILEGWGSVDIEDSRFEDNVADDNGGHVYIELPDHEVRMRRVELVGGEADDGGAIYATRSGLRLENTLLADNQADDGGGALDLDEVSGAITNSLLLDNEAENGAGIRIDDGTWDLWLTNTVLDGHREGAAIQLVWGWGPTVHYTAFHGNDRDFDGMLGVLGRNGNTSQAPDFVDRAAGNYRLAPGSALIDAGDPDLTDPDGTRSDIGLHGGPGAAP